MVVRKDRGKTDLGLQSTTGRSIPNQERGVISSISPCEGDGPGANPGFLTNLDGPKLIGYPPPKEGVAS